MEKSQDKPSFKAEILEWLGKRSKISFLFTGLFWGFISFWTLYQVMLYPMTSSVFDKTIEERDNRISSLSQELLNIKTDLNSLRDSIRFFTSVGTYLGTHEIPILSAGEGADEEHYRSILGNRIKALAWNYGIKGGPINIGVDLIIDTCPPRPLFVEDSSRSVCGKMYYWITATEHVYCPVFIGDNKYFIYFNRANEDLIEVSLYWDYKME